MGFLAFVLVVVVGVHYYLWRRLVRDTTVPGGLRRALTWALAGMVLLLVLAMAGTRVWASSIPDVLVWPGYMWLAVMFYLLVILVVLEIPRAIAILATRRKVAAPEPVPVGSGAGAVATEEAPPVPPVDRRLFISRSLAAVAGVGAIATVGYGARTALGDPVIRRLPIGLANLDPALSGLRVAVVSDIHLGPLTGLGHTQRIVRMINGLNADIVAIVGDLVDGSVAELGPLARPFADLRSTHGAFFVTGNHEYYTANGPKEWEQELTALGVRSLRNERVEIRQGAGVLDLAGVDDIAGATMDDGPDFGKALGGRDTGRPVILLAHQPVQVAEAAKFGVDLQLSGHTHGGQMVPFNLVVPLQQPVVSGLDTIDGTQVFVTRGAGFWGPPVRVGAPPEIALLELRPVAAS